MGFFKKILLKILFLIFAFSSFTTNIIFANNNPAIDNISIKVDLAEGGTAFISEVWDVKAVSGTEWYIVYKNMGDMQLSNFSVTDESGTKYENIGEWDVDASIEQKKYKSGIVTTDSDGYELCWGIGNYDNHRFTITYELSNFVVAYDDYDGFNHEFITNNLSSAPQNINIFINQNFKEISQENIGAWAFGFEGNVDTSDGKVFVNSSRKLESHENVIVMLQFDKNIFAPVKTINGSFEDVKQRALEGSSYTPDNQVDTPDYNDNYSQNNNSEIPFFIIFLLIFGMVFFSPFVILILAVKSNYNSAIHLKENSGYKNINKKSFLNDVDYFRDFPFEKDLPSAYWTLKSLQILVSDGNIIGAYLLKWIYDKNIKMTSFTQKILFGSKDISAIIFLKTGTNMQKLEKELFLLLKSASDHQDMLAENELAKWSEKNYTTIKKWFKSYEKSGLNSLVKSNMIEYVERKIIFKKTDVPVLNSIGADEAMRLLGLKRYLQDFSIINEREPASVELWDYYLIYAQIFGIADKVQESFRNLYPEYFERMSQDYTYTQTFVMVNAISHSYQRGINNAQSSSYSGGGGSSSGGGGGGSSGGGGGGGSR